VTVAYNSAAATGSGQNIENLGTASQFQIASSVVGMKLPSCVGPVTGNTYDLSDDPTCFGPSYFLGLDTVMGANGGPTKTLKLVPGSKAIDAVGSGCISDDQRHYDRAVGATCDAGAYEDNSPGPSCPYGGGPAGISILSQDFEPELDPYDSQGAADFMLSSTCTFKKVVVPGEYFNGAGPARDETVTFYRDDHGRPGTVAKRYEGLHGADEAGTFDINLPATKLKKGTYWISVEANMDFSAGGEWGWFSTSQVTGARAMWQNPGDGFGTGCTTWGDMVTCVGDVGEGPDFLFYLS